MNNSFFYRRTNMTNNIAQNWLSKKGVQNCWPYKKAPKTLGAFLKPDRRYITEQIEHQCGLAHSAPELKAVRQPTQKQPPKYHREPVEPQRAILE